MTVHIREQTIEYRDGEAHLSGLFVWSDDVGSERPGLLVVHGGAGLDDHAKLSLLAVAAAAAASA